MDKLIIECPHCHEKFSGEEAFQDILDQTLESHKNSINEDLKNKQRQMPKIKLLKLKTNLIKKKKN